MRKQRLPPQPAISPPHAPGTVPHPAPPGVTAVVVADEPAFTRHIYLERRRAERNQRSLVLILVDATAMADLAARGALLRTLIGRLPDMLRDTDVLGWYRHDSILGMLLPDLESVDQGLIRSLLHKAANLLQNSLGPALTSRLQLTVHVFPDPLKLSGNTVDLALYPELPWRSHSQQFQAAIKRFLDIVISLLTLLLFSPLCLLLAVAIKCSSPGPALFRQERLGQYGRPFICLKFRSMYAASDASVHKSYVTRFIAGTGPAGAAGVFKLTDDRRVTLLGRILRRMSLDELPQLWNVLRGEMSLVGPRPPLPYEFDLYAPWQRRRILETKPGLTGLWQVRGRSRTTFDEMVRMDLRYGRHWSLWLDLKILLSTPAAVLFGKGAY